MALQGFDLKLIPYELSEDGSRSVSVSGKKTLFLIGGEGGFTAGEVEEARAAGFSEISSGKNDSQG